MKSSLAIAACSLALGSAFTTSERQAAAAVVAACAVTDLKLDVSEDSPGAGHFGVLVTLTNVAAAPCSLPQAPTFEFQNDAGLDIATGAAPKANVVLAAGQSGYAHAIWSDGTGTNGPCLDATKFSVHVAPAPNALSAMLAAHMCTTDIASPLFTAYAFSLSRAPVLPTPSSTP